MLARCRYFGDGTLRNFYAAAESNSRHLKADFTEYLPLYSNTSRRLAQFAGVCSIA
jgi:hypothetical protein